MRFMDKYEYLSNFYLSEIITPNDTFPTVEHGFQASKTIIELEKEKIINADTPGKAKRLGRKVTLRKDWEMVKIPNMFYLVTLKFYQHPELMKQLLTTDGTIYEHNTWCDNFWGYCMCEKCKDKDKQKLNILGIILTTVRNIAASKGKQNV